MSEDESRPEHELEGEEDAFGELVQNYNRPRGRGGADLMQMGLARRYSQIPNIPTPNSVYTNYNEGDRVSLLLIPTNIIVIPGLMFPLRFRDDQHTGLQFALLKNLLDSDDPNVFGAVHVPNEDERLEDTWCDCGVTVQILEVTEENQSKLELKCMGRQRYEVISEELTSRHMRATVEIHEDQKQPRLLDPAGKVKDTFLRGPLPVWQHRLRDVFTLEKLIKNEITTSCPGINADSAPTEPIMFSYWIISTMPFKFKQRNKMLREDNLIVRLRSQLNYLRLLNHFDYCCLECGPNHPVVSCSDLMSMKSEGPFYHLKPEGMFDETVLTTNVNTDHVYWYGTATRKSDLLDMVEHCSVVKRV